MEAEAEAVDGRLEEREAKEKLTAVASLAKIFLFNWNIVKKSTLDSAYKKGKCVVMSAT